MDTVQTEDCLKGPADKLKIVMSALPSLYGIFHLKSENILKIFIKIQFI